MNNSKPRWEIKYEQYLAEEPISDKIKKIEKSIKDKIKRRQAKIGKIEAQKVTGNFKTKEEYEVAVEAHKKEIEDVKKEKADLEASLEHDEKLQGYRNFEKNKEKIKNIYEYRNILIKKLEKLPIDTKVELEEKKQEQKARLSRIRQYEVEIENINKQLTEEKSLTDEQKQILSLELRTKTDEKEKLHQEGIKATVKIADLEKKGKNFSENTIIKKEEYQRKIAKCNLIAANLLKGKKLEDITIKVEEDEKRFTSKEGKLNKKVENAREEKQEKNGKVIKYGKQVEKNAMTEVTSFEQKHPRLAKIGKFFKNLFKKKDKTKSADEEASKNDYENELLKEIAEKGAEKTFRERLAINKQNVANSYAEKYGGIYERQDGATAKKKTVQKGSER